MRSVASPPIPNSARALSLDEVLAIHDVPGGTAPLRIRAALAVIKEKLSIYAGVAHAGT